MQLENIGTIASTTQEGYGRVRFFNGLKETTVGKINKQLTNDTTDYIIDVTTKDANKITRLLNSYKIDTEIGGSYREDTEHTQLLCKAKLTEEQLDWLLWSKNVDYIGVVEAK
jgi:hypothetical protein